VADAMIEAYTPVLIRATRRQRPNTRCQPPLEAGATEEWTL
jgi:hypothetical protein